MHAQRVGVHFHHLKMTLGLAIQHVQLALFVLVSVKDVLDVRSGFWPFFFSS